MPARTDADEAFVNAGKAFGAARKAYVSGLRQVAARITDGADTLERQPVGSLLARSTGINLGAVTETLKRLCEAYDDEHARYVQAGIAVARARTRRTGDD